MVEKTEILSTPYHHAVTPQKTTVFRRALEVTSLLLALLPVGVRVVCGTSEAMTLNKAEAYLGGTGA
jgi:hypothetical protein